MNSLEAILTWWPRCAPASPNLRSPRLCPSWQINANAVLNAHDSRMTHARIAYLHTSTGTDTHTCAGLVHRDPVLSVSLLAWLDFRLAGGRELAVRCEVTMRVLWSLRVHPCAHTCTHLGMYMCVYLHVRSISVVCGNAEGKLSPRRGWMIFSLSKIFERIFKTCRFVE